MKPEQFKAGSNAKVFFKCEEKGHPKEYSIYNRVRLKTSCPICNNFGDNHPELLKELHPTKNLDFNPYEVPQFSHKKSGRNVLKDMNIKPVLHTEKRGNWLLEM